MKENLYYENHLGEKIEFKKNKSLYVNENTLRDFVWNFDSDSGTISNLNKRGVISKSLPVVIAAPLESANQFKNEFFEIFEKDVIAFKNGNKDAKGKLWCGDYYYKCLIVGSSKAMYLKTKRITQFSLTVVSDEPIWIKEKSQIITPVIATGGFDFPFEFPFDFENSFSQMSINQDYFQPVDFKITIRAVTKEIINPAVVIGDNRYQVLATVPINHMLVIDSRNRTIYIENQNGLRTNAINSRNKEFDIFAQIQQGEQHISWDNENTFDFELTTYKERGEPEWI